MVGSELVSVPSLYPSAFDITCVASSETSFTDSFGLFLFDLEPNVSLNVSTPKRFARASYEFTQ
jgi:hypothetical protein